MARFKRRCIFQTIFFGIHLSFCGCTNILISCPVIIDTDPWCFQGSLEGTDDDCFDDCQFVRATTIKCPTASKRERDTSSSCCFFFMMIHKNPKFNSELAPKTKTWWKRPFQRFKGEMLLWKTLVGGFSKNGWKMIRFTTWSYLRKHNKVPEKHQVPYFLVNCGWF